MRNEIEKTSLIVGLVLVIVGSLLYIGSVTLQLGCGPGSLPVQSACDDLRTSQFFSMWFLGASSFVLALVMLLSGERKRLSLQQVLWVGCFVYGVIPFVLFFTMTFTGLPGSGSVFQVTIAYYLLALVAGLVILFGRAKELGIRQKI